MKYMYFLLPACLILSCADNENKDFTDKAIDFVIENRSDTYIDLPDLYPDPVKQIPTSKDEKIILAQRLRSRGFTMKDSIGGNFQLSGQRFILLTMADKNCQCDVMKIYNSTPYVSQYNVSERMKCR